MCTKRCDWNKIVIVGKAIALNCFRADCKKILSNILKVKHNNNDQFIYVMFINYIISVLAKITGFAKC